VHGVRCHLIRLGCPVHPAELAAIVDRPAWASLPLPPADLSHATWCSADLTAHAYSWSNEGPTSLPVKVRGGIALTTGYSRGSLVAAVAAVDEPDQDELLAEAGGVWSAAYVTSGRLVVTTSYAGVDGWFHARSEDGSVWVGSRALLVHIASRRSSRPELDLIALAGLVNAGYMLTDRTPYAGTRYAGAGVTWSACMKHRDSRPEISSRPRHRPQRPDRASGEAGAAVAEALKSAASGLPSTSGPIRMGLTGGRDSRLIVAALVAAGKEVTTFTRGPDGNADVEVARRVARALSVPHKRVDRKGTKGDIFEVDPYARIRTAVVLCDGQISAYDATGGAGRTFAPTRLALSGSGGEMLRGGYAKIQAMSHNPRAGARWMETKTLYPAVGLLHPDLRKPYVDDVRGWLDRVSNSPLEAMSEFYLSQRTARWFGASRLGTSLAANARTLFLDDGVLTACFSAPIEGLANESVYRDALFSLRPDLRDVPYIGKRLICDARPPGDHEEWQRWVRRAPVPSSTTGIAGSSWRRHYGDEVAEILRTTISASHQSGLLIDSAASDAVPRAGVGDATTARTAWHAATAAAIGSESFYDPTTRHQHVAEVIIVATRLGEATSRDRGGRSLSERVRALGRRSSDLTRHVLARARRVAARGD
jgi:asparagine synthetase B (glutamine-hydrolysing)